MVVITEVNSAVAFGRKDITDGIGTFLCLIGWSELHLNCHPRAQVPEAKVSHLTRNAGTL